MLFHHNKKNGIIAFHGIQSFKKDEVTPEVAHEIGVKLAEEMWGDRFEVVVSTHLNTKCIHNHFVIYQQFVQNLLFFHLKNHELFGKFLLAFLTKYFDTEAIHYS